MKHPTKPKSLCEVIYEALAAARAKHPQFAKDKREAAHAIEAELTKLYEAIAYETAARQRAKALDVAVTALRFYLGEYDHAT